MILELSQLCKSYQAREGRVVALEPLDLRIRAGEIFGLLGPNGAGKTTAVKMIMGFLHPSGGTVRFRNRTLAVSDPRQGIGYLPESFRPNPHLTVAEYVRLHCMLAGTAAEGPEEESAMLLERVGMVRFGRRRISDLSKGMGQRVGLAQAFAGDPDLLVLDEPTSGLDPLGRGEVIDLLLSLKRAGKTIFFSSHILSEVERLCDRIGILVGGELRFLGTAADFRDRWGVDDFEQGFKMEARCAAS